MVIFAKPERRLSFETRNEPMLPDGTKLHGTYRIVRSISSGGFANTYEAVNAFGETVAVKEFFMTGIASRAEGTVQVRVTIASNRKVFNEQKDKFVKEAKRLHRYNDRHIVRVHDLFEENGTAYYIMDYIDGHNLEEHLKATGRAMTEEEVMPILLQVLGALHSVHGDGSDTLLHLDLKPANIMLDAAGNAVLIDFGSSKQISGSSRTTTPTAVTYTKGYGAREQMEQDINKFGPWTDFYALGATLYKLLTNTPTLPMPSDIEEDDTPLKEHALPLPADVSPVMQRLIVWMMQTARYARPQSVEQIEDFLRVETNKGNLPDWPFFNGMPSDVVPAPPTKPAQKDEDTQKAGQAPEENAEDQTESLTPHDEESAEEAPRKRKWLKPLVLAATVLTMACALLFFFLPQKKVTKKDTTPTTIAADEEPVKNVNAVEIEVLGVPCLYYGSVDSRNRPHGGGKAVSYSSNPDDFTIYTGRFIHGLMDGQGEQEWADGKKFVGTFKSNFFDEGRYTQKDGVYYIGSFRTMGNMAAPWNGIWYDKNDKVLRTIKGGKSV